MGVSKDILYSVPQVDLHQVTHGQQQYLSKGPFSISLEHNDDQQQMMAEVLHQLVSTATCVRHQYPVAASR
jgi:hypothetical protein